MSGLKSLGVADDSSSTTSQMHQMLASVRHTFGLGDGYASAASRLGGGVVGRGQAEAHHRQGLGDGGNSVQQKRFRTTTPGDDIDPPWADLLDTIPKDFFTELLSFSETGSGDGQKSAPRTSPFPSQAPRARTSAASAATQQATQQVHGEKNDVHAQWSPEEWGLDDHSLSIEDLRSSAASSVQSRAAGDEAAVGAQLLDPGEPGLSKREAVRRLRLQRAADKKIKQAATREELLRKGAKCCEAVGCCEPRMSESRRICALHKGSLKLSFEAETEPHRWCLYCHLCHPVSSFDGGTRTICGAKYELRYGFRKSHGDSTGEEVEGTSSPSSTLRKRRKVEREDSGPDRVVLSAASTSTAESDCGAGVDDKSDTHGSRITQHDMIGYDEAMRFGLGSYQTSYRYEILDVKVGMNPNVLVHEDSLFMDAIASLHQDYDAACSHSSDIFGRTTAPSRVGTPAMAAMMPGCTQLTISSMTLTAPEGGDSLRSRVTRLVAVTGASELLDGERWGVTMTTSGTDKAKVDEVYCAAAYGERVVAEHKGLSWPTEVRTPLCVVADAVVTLDLLEAAQPSAVRWFGDGINTKTIATVTGDSTPPAVSLRVPPSECCSLLSVQMLVSGQCMGSAFQHILVLPNGDDRSNAIARELISCHDTIAADDISDEEQKRAAIHARRMWLYRTVITDLVWLLSAHESGAVFESETVITRAITISSGLQLVFSAEYGCPVLEQRLVDIELDLREYAHCEDDGRNWFSNATEINASRRNENDVNGEADGVAVITWTWWKGFDLSYLETKYRYERLLVTQATMPRMSLLCGTLFILTHFKMLQLHDNLPPVAIRDLNISLMVFTVAFGFTQLLHHKFGKQFFHVYPYDGSVVAIALHQLVLHDVLAFSFNSMLFTHLLVLFHYLYTFAYRMSPFQTFTHFFAVNIFFGPKTWFFSRRWALVELGAINLKQILAWCSLMLAPHVVVVVLVVGYLDVRHRRAFIKSQKFSKAN